jgi:hypothetical protein
MDLPAGYDAWKTTPPQMPAHDAQIEVVLIIKKDGSPAAAEAGADTPERERYEDVAKAIKLMESAEMDFELSADHGDMVLLTYTANDVEMSEHDPEYTVRSEMIPPQVQMLCEDIDITVSGLPQGPDFDDDSYERDFDH